MSNKYKRFAKYINKLRKKLRLRDWEIYVGKTVQSKVFVAQIEVSPYMKEACIEPSKYFWKASRVLQRYYCVHELIHIHIERMEHALLDSLPGRLRGSKKAKRRARKAILRTHTRANELTTDTLASILAEFLPLPPKNLK